MKLIRHIAAIPAAAKGGVVAIGNFDGLHLGHQFLLQQAKDEARSKKKPLIVLSFEPHPRRFFALALPPFRLTPFASKYKLLDHFGVDYFLCLHFNQSLSQLSADEFVQRILIDGLQASAVYVGADFVFGHKRGGSTETLRRYERNGAFRVHGSELLQDAGSEPVSSSRVRDFLKAGECEKAAKLLGRNWAIVGHVRGGRRLGRTLGFPTANVLLQDYQHPAYGVYAVRVHTPMGLRNGVANIGIRPTIGGTTPQLEVYIFDFNQDLYGKRISVELIQFLRPEMKFPGIEELRAQIARDVDHAKEILGK